MALNGGSSLWLTSVYFAQRKVPPRGGGGCPCSPVPSKNCFGSPVPKITFKLVTSFFIPKIVHDILSLFPCSPV